MSRPLRRAILSVVQQEKDTASLDRKLREFLAGKVPEAQIGKTEGRTERFAGAWEAPALETNSS